jgi:tetrahydromethanopterin S-methyltransferase subunit C
MAVGDPQPADDLRDQPISELVKTLSDEASTLIRQEIALAKAEIAQKAKSTGVGVGMMGAAYVFLRLTIATATAAAILALAIPLPAWAAALIVTIVWAGIALVLILFGRQQIKRGLPPVPQQTIETVKEDVAWLKSRARSARR